MARSITFIIQAQDKMSAALNKMKGSMDRLNSSAKRAGSIGTAMSAIGTVVVGAVGIMGNSILKYETKMNALESATESSGETMAAFRKKAREMGSTTVFSATEAADALLKLGQAGFEPKKAMEALEPTLNLAAAGALSMGEAAVITNVALKAYEFEVNQSGRVADVLAKASTMASTTVSDLGSSLGKAGTVAKGAGVGFEELVAMMSIAQDRGIEVSTVGTSMRAVILGLAAPTALATRAMKHLGLTQKDLKEKNAVGMLKKMSVRFKELESDQKRTAITAALFGRENASLGSVLLTSTDTIDKNVEKLKNLDNTAGKMAKTQMKGLPGAVAKLNSKVNEAVLSLGAAGLTGALVRIANKVAELVTWFNNLSPTIKKVIIVGMLLGSSLLVIGLGMVVLSTAFSGIITIIKGMIAIFRIAKAVTLALNLALLANPIGFAIGVIGLAIAAYLLFEDQIDSVITKIAAFVSEVVPFGDVIVDMFKKIRDGFNSVRDFLGSGLMSLLGIGDNKLTIDKKEELVAKGLDEKLTPAENITKAEANARATVGGQIDVNVNGIGKDQVKTTVANNQPIGINMMAFSGV